MERKNSIAPCKFLASFMLITVLVSMMSVSAFAANTSDTPWKFVVGYGNSNTGARRKENNTVTYVLWQTCKNNKLLSMRAAVYGSNTQDETLGNCTTNAGYYININKGSPAGISSSALANYNGWCKLSLSSGALFKSDTCTGQWSPDSVPF